MRSANAVAHTRVALGLALVAAVVASRSEAQAQSPGAGPGTEAPAAAPAGSASTPAAAAPDANPNANPNANPDPTGTAPGPGAPSDTLAATADSPALAPTGNSAGASAGMDDVPAANLRLRRLEQRVQALKERAWRTKARVRMLEEKVLGGGVGANATIVHVDQMGRSYELVQLVYNLDGTQVFARKDDDGVVDADEELQILAGPVSPGSHTVTVLAVYEGRGYGVFKYMNKYRFTVRSSHTFTASEGKATRIEAVALERGNITTPVDQRPAIDFTVSYGQSGPGGAAPASGRERDPASGFERGPERGPERDNDRTSPKPTPSDAGQSEAK